MQKYFIYDINNSDLFSVLHIFYPMLGYDVQHQLPLKYDNKKVIIHFNFDYRLLPFDPFRTLKSQ